MEPKANDLFVGDIYSVVTVLMRWSRKSFQGFLESGIAHDFAEAVKLKDFSIHNTSTEIMGYAYWGVSEGEKVSIQQAIKIMSSAVNLSRKEWEHFFQMVDVLGLNSRYFEDNSFNWEKRDYLRVILGLQPFNPIYQNEQGQEIVFRRTGHCSVWDNLELGYRYAYTGEIPISVIELLDSVVVHTGSGHYSWKKLLVVGNEIKTWDIDANRFFHNHVFYVPLIKNC